MNNSSTPHSSLLDALAPDYLRTLARQGQVRHYRKNTLLIQEGDVGAQLYVVLHGNLREFAMSQDSKPREITLAMAGRGDVLGLLALEGGSIAQASSPWALLSVPWSAPKVCGCCCITTPIWPWLCYSGPCSACVWQPKPPV